MLKNVSLDIWVTRRAATSVLELDSLKRERSGFVGSQPEDRIEVQLPLD
jgi:hypothetical protein